MKQYNYIILIVSFHDNSKNNCYVCTTYKERPSIRSGALLFYLFT